MLHKNLKMPNNKKITTLFLDIGGVLLSNGWGHEFRQVAAEYFDLELAEMEDRHKIMFVVYEEGRITLEEYLNRVVFYTPRNFSRDAFRDYMFGFSTANTEMIDFIIKLKEEYHLKVVAVSNEAKELNEYRLHTFRLNRFIDFFISSCYVHIRKPDSNIFKMALHLAQVSADEVVYIDDVQMFTDIATDLGIKSFCHSDWQTTSTALADIGLRLKINKTVHV